MRHVISLALSVATLIVFAGSAPAQQKLEKRAPVPPSNGAKASAEQAEEAQLLQYAECLLGAQKKSEQKRQELAKQARTSEAAAGLWSLYHGRKKTIEL